MGDENTNNAFDLSDEDFDQMLEDGQSSAPTTEEENVNVNISTPGDETPGDETPGDETPGDETPGDETETIDIDVDEILKDEKGKSIEVQKVDLVHKGKTVSVTIDEAINLAQKGYDYKDKTTALAPHRRLVELVEGDEGLQEVINNYVTGKTVGDVKKREDFDTEDEWLKANIEKAVSSVAPFTTGKAEEGTDTSLPPGQGKTPQEAPIVTEMRQRDPDNFDKIAPHFINAAKQLTVEQYQQISTSKENVVKLYDIVKERVLKGPDSSSTGLKGRQKTFNLRSNRTNPGKRTPKKNVWDLSNKDFEKQLQRAKGY